MKHVKLCYLQQKALWTITGGICTKQNLNYASKIQVVSRILNKETITIYRWDQNNLPTCPRCTTVMTNYATLISHAYHRCHLNVQEITTNLQLLEETESTHSNENTMYIEQPPFAIIADYQIAVCTICKYGVFREHLKRHAMKHQVTWNPIDDIWNQVIAKDDPIPSIHAVLKGIQVAKNAFQCMECFKVFPSHGTKRNHRYVTKHNNFEKCAAVNIFKSKVKWQRVSLPSQRQIQPNTLRDILSRSQPRSNQTEWRNVQQCFITLGWVDIVEDMSEDELEIFRNLSTLSPLETDIHNKYLTINDPFIATCKRLCRQFLSQVNDSMSSYNYWTRLQISR